MSDCPHVNAGYIQAEETDFRRSTDTHVYTQMGSNLNYLKDQSDTANTLATSIFANTYQCQTGSLGYTTDGSGNFQGVAVTTPNLKNIFLAVVRTTIGGFSPPVGLNCMGPYVTIPMHPSGGSAQPSGTGNYPLLSVQFINKNQLYFVIQNGSGFGWSPGTGGTFSWAIVFKT